MDQLDFTVLSLRTSSTWKPRAGKLTLSTVAAVCLLVDVGCSSPTNPNYRIAELEQTSERISDREQRCIHAANKRALAEVSRRESTKTADNGQQDRDIDNRRARDIINCETEADRETEELSASEVAEYELEAQEASAHAARLGLVATYPTSR
jgi:hypothetical protein